MANEVKIKLSADGTQVRRELKLIDQELNEIGKDSTKIPGKQNTGSNRKSETPSREPTNSNEKAKQESRDKTTSEIAKELALIRKELQKLNSTGGKGGNPGNSDGGGLSPLIPGSGGSSSGSGNGGLGGLGKLFGDLGGKVAIATTALKAVSATYSSLKSSAQTAQTGASLAYKTYGSTLAYTDYNQARKDASVLGKDYGYDVNTVMNAGNANMEGGAGFTTLNNYNSDMASLLKASKALGIDTGTLSQASGLMTSIGVTESGKQQRFANILAQSIVDANMKGREGEQLRVLENIADDLSSVNSSVSEKGVTSSLQLYNSLVNQNENLKGERGSEVISSLNSFATSDNSTLMHLLGYGTQYTGLQGMQELRRKIEENPTEAIQDAYQTYMKENSGVLGYEQAKAQFSEMIYKNTGMSQTKVDDAIKAVEEKTGGTYDTSKGETLIKKATENYLNDKISTEERYDIEKQENSADRGNWFNNITKPFENLYNSLPDWAQQGADVIGGGAKYVGGGLLAKKGVSWLGSKLGGVKAVPESFASFADDLVDAYNSGGDIDGVLSKLTKGGSISDDMYNWADDVVDAYNTGSGNVDDLLSQGYSKFGKNLAGSNKSVSSVLGSAKGKIIGNTIGSLIQAGVGAYKYSKAGNNWEKSGVIGETVGGIVGQNVGSALAGPLGAIGLSWVGNEAGEEIGNNWQNAKVNYGTGLASLPLIGGLWRKNGTLTQQRIKKEESQAQSKNDISVKSNTESIDELTESIDTLNQNLSNNDAITSLDSSFTPGKSSISKSWSLFSHSHATGNNYVPYDNYAALLHKGEMVLTSSEADDYRQGKVGNNNGVNTSMNININVNGAIDGMTSDNQERIVQAIVTQISSSGLQDMISNGFIRTQNY